MKLFCIPYAGGSAAIYSRWKAVLHPAIELVPLELPGRGSRIGEKLCGDLGSLVRDAVTRIRTEAGEGPYAVFGHSLGSLIAYEAVHDLLGHGGPAPQHLFLSGRGAVHLEPERERLLYPLPDEEFMEAIYELGGTPREVLQHKEIVSLFLPILRADYRIAETYAYRERPPFAIDLTVMYGTGDRPHLPNMPEWNRHTQGTCRLIAYEGDHFFLNDSSHRTEMIRAINDTLRAPMPAGWAGSLHRL
ncbi:MULTISPECIES: thioesterase II family protein [Paenibacillus]|uniref:thioesterase II family protein n=1 Tax=Paenibacillus TaxID=44249 RepID=UPI0022B8E13F|nr:alpha/beta fold hydrolase [Paenibacillus caseinilyticus]MCZ8519463.1 alpha/beta fold hydrolase [Paenibacillus caseinilyticus]